MRVNLQKAASDQEGSLRSYVIKQLDQSDVMATSNRLPDDEFKKAHLENTIIAPPYDPYQLSILVETSSILDQCIDTMEVNVDSFGYELRPSVDDETYQELLANPQAKAEIDREWQEIMNFFKYCNRRLSYIQLRRRFRRDYEVTGNAYIEILRNQMTNRITGLEWLPSITMRATRIDKMFTDYVAKRKVNDIQIEQMGDKMRFRRYVQIKEQTKQPIWFKEFQDPRLMDSETGARARVTRDKEGKIKDIIPVHEDHGPQFDVQKFKDGKMRLATEVLHFDNYHSTRTLPYGSPRWIGNLISIMGSRSSEEINLQYFDNKTVPPGMLLVSGGRLGEDTVNRITNHVKENIKGSKNFHSILVVEATGAKPNPNQPLPPSPTLQWVNMTNSQTGDGLFQGYDQNNIEKVISSFRFWSGYVARTKEINVATAEVARQISEEQVFQPERDSFDAIINRTLLVEMGINYWEHRTKGPQLASPQQMADILDKTKSFLTGQEGREICKSIFGREFKDLKADWLDRPLSLVIAELAVACKHVDDQIAAVKAGKEPQAPGEPKDPETEQRENLKKWENLPNDEQTLVEFVSKLMVVREALEKAETTLATRAMRGA